MTQRLFIGAALLLATGCANRFMITTYYIPQAAKVVRAQQALAGGFGNSAGDADVVNYYMQICDLSEGQATNCKTSLVLDNVLSVNFSGTGW
jgi:hypothetical protein